MARTTESLIGGHGMRPSRPHQRSLNMWFNCFLTMRWSAIQLIDNGVQYPILLLDHVKIIDSTNSLLLKKEWSVDFLRGPSAPQIPFRAGSFEFLWDVDSLLPKWGSYECWLGHSHGMWLCPWASIVLTIGRHLDAAHTSPLYLTSGDGTMN